MYRDDATALGEQGAALEEQLAPLRAAGPPGAVARIAEIERQKRALGRFAWPYALLLGTPLLYLARWGTPLSDWAIPAALAIVSLWLELQRQRGAQARLREQLAERARRPRPAATVTTANPEHAGLAQQLEHQEALARELSVYRATGTRDEALDTELTREREDLARHGRPFLWLAAVVLPMVMPTTQLEPFSLMPAIAGALGLVLASFAVRLGSHARALTDRLAVARRELRAAESSVDAPSRAPGTPEADAEVTATLRDQTRAVRLARAELSRLREARDGQAQPQARAWVTVIACGLGAMLMVPALTAGTLGSAGFLFLAVMVIVAVAALAFAVNGLGAQARRSRAVRLAELEEDAATYHLHRLRVSPAVLSGPPSGGISPRTRVDVENLLEEEVPSSASYHQDRELP